MLVSASCWWKIAALIERMNDQPSNANPDRRGFLKGGAALLIGAVTAPIALAADGGSSGRSLIQRENEKPGTRDWQLTRVRLDKTGGFRSPTIEGYCSRQSLLAGETLQIMVSVRPATKFTLEIFRTGYYGGTGARLMTTIGPLQGEAQAEPPVGEKRLRECKWTPSTTLKIPDDWPSGVYLGRLSTVPENAGLPYWQSYVIFIVRDTRRADVLLQCSDNTWQAYNRWPNDYSLYTDPRGAHARDVAVSFDRPYGKFAQIYENPQSVGSGEWLCFEFPLAYWLEQHGYDVSYCSNSDCLDAAQITRCKSFLSVGHDEYWDVRQYQAVQRAIEAGVNVLWLCGNSVFAVSPFTASVAGQPNRVITREGHFAGLTDQEVAKAERVFTKEYKRAGPDESLIIGARSIIPFNGGGDWVCTKPDHWIFAGTGLKHGDAIPGLVGWEHHGAPAKIPGLEIVAEGTVWASGVTPAHWTATIYPGPKGNFVFNAATIFWTQGLASPPGHMLPWSHGSRPHGPDPRVQRITENLLRRAIGR
jgi:hypothetical protein